MSVKKFRIVDSQVLHRAYQEAIQMQALIEEAVGAEKGPEALPESLVPTDTLYDLASCIVAMYNILVQQELVEFNTQKLLKQAKIH